MAFTATRLYAGEPDLQLIIDLLVAVRPPNRITVYPGIVDLHELLALSNVQANTRLWFTAENRVVAFAVVDHFNNLLFEIDQHAAYPGIAAEIVDWGESCVRRFLQNGETGSLDASCREDDFERIELLERHGFGRQDIQSLRMARSLHQPIPAPELPPGFSIRHVTGEAEVEALVALHRLAFGTTNMTVAERLAMMRIPGYDPEMDLLVIAPDGSMAAYCMCSISQEENLCTGCKEGHTDPVATHPGFQGRGLAKALLLAGLQKLKERGVDTAVLGTSSENIAMQRAASVVGFRIQSITSWFSRPISLVVV
jgi:ribosomal protein S18 acetylase RimI-like enzyme